MAFKMKKPIWHGTDSHKQALKSGAPSKYDYLSDQGDENIDVQSSASPEDDLTKQTTEGPDKESAIDNARNEKKKEIKTGNTTEETTTDEYNLDGSKKHQEDQELPYPDLSKFEIYTQ